MADSNLSPASPGLAGQTVVTERPVGHHGRVHLHGDHLHGDHDIHHAEHVVGTMDVTDHQRTFDGFVRFLTWNVVAIIVVLIFMALADA